MRPLRLTFSLVLLSLLAACQTLLPAKLASEERAGADRLRDPGRKPEEVLTFLGVKRGMTAVDVIAAGGYYTEVLSLAVGSNGTVYAQNPKRVLEFRDGVNDKTLTERLAGNRLPNVIRWDREFADLGIEGASVDVAITALNYHDVYNGSGKDAAVGFSRAILSILKPGGIFGVIDHSGSPHQDNVKLHRIEIHLVLETLEQAGFEIEATSDLLRNPGDDLTRMVFDPDIRGRTDRFLIRARKPT